MVPAVPTMTSQDQPSAITRISASVRSTRFTPPSRPSPPRWPDWLARTRVMRPSRKTPSSEPNVTPAILKASQRILSKNENPHASSASITPKAATAMRDTRQVVARRGARGRAAAGKCRRQNDRRASRAGESMEASTMALSMRPRRSSSGMAVRMKCGKISSGRGSVLARMLRIVRVQARADGEVDRERHERADRRE